MSKEKILLVGNGIYRAFHGEDESWENVLRFVKKEFEKQGMSLTLEPNSENISYSLYFEYLYAEWKKKKGLKSNETETWKSFAEEIANILNLKYKSPEYVGCTTVINEMVWNHFDVVLTTNIENRFEKVVTDVAKDADCDDDKTEEWASACNRKWKYSVYRRKEWNDGKKKIFYMHGELGKPYSICFGLDHYLGEYMCQYDILYGIKPDEKRVVLKWLNGEECVTDDECKDSWLYHFFFNDVDIIGQGLGKDEIDVWWAIEKRFQYRLKRENRSNVIEDNRIRFFIPSFRWKNNLDKIKLLNAFGVETQEIHCSDDREFYKIYFEDFAENNCLDNK